MFDFWLRNDINSMELGGLKLTNDEEEPIVALIKTLSDGYIPTKGN